MNKGNNTSSITIVSIIILVVVFFITIGWSSFNSSLLIDSLTMVRIKSDVRVTGFKSVTMTNSASSINEEYNVNSLYGTINLPNSLSTVKYRVQITNMELASNVHMGINSISGLPDNLNILSIEDYSLKTKLCDDNNPSDCGIGAQKTFYITIGYKDSNVWDSNNTIYNFMLNFEFKKVYDINYTGFTNPPNFPKTVMDGDVTSISFGSDARDNLSIISGGEPLILNIDYIYNNHILTFLTPIKNDIYIVNPSTYTITYELNGGIQASGQITTYSVLNPETLLAPTKDGYTFGGWYETMDFSSDVITSTSQLMGNATLYASWGVGIARIGNTYYNSLQDAINAVPINDVETTVTLLADTQEYLSVSNHQNINFNLGNYIISSLSGRPVLETNGTIKISNGTITSNTTQGAINVNDGGVLYMSGGTISTTGSKQAIYIDGGTVYISGSANLKSTSNQRATVHNSKPNNRPAGLLIITGGNITSTHYSAIVNAGTMTIGIKDGLANEIPVITGYINGINSSVNYNYYDGIIKGKNTAVNNEEYIKEMEDDYVFYRGIEKINDITYKTISFVKQFTVTFNPNGGEIIESERIIRDGNQIGKLPVPTKEGYYFDGWYTLSENGREITESEVIHEDSEFFAHWLDNSEVVVARIGTVNYSSLQEAIDAAPNNIETTVFLERNTIENILIGKNKNIILNLGNYKLTNSTALSTVTNKGTLKINNGIITSNSDTAATINNDPGGVLIVTGGSIIATGKRQSIYNDGGTVTIDGNAYLNAKALVETTNMRGTVQNLANGTLLIKGGIIESSGTDGIALTNLGHMTIGTKDGNIKTTPVIKGIAIGINNTGTFNFYDGIIKSSITTVNGIINDKEDNSIEVTNSEIINGITYNTLTLSFLSS